MGNYFTTNVDLRYLCPPIYNQGQLGDCTACAIAAAYEFNEMKEHIFTPSRLFIYYNARKINGTINEDSGVTLHIGVQSIVHYGTCSESLWQYDIDKFKDKPSPECYFMARNHRCTKYNRVAQTLDATRSSLIAGYPFVFGINLYSSFYDESVAKTGNVTVPQSNESIVGGHAMICVGFDDIRNVFIVRNSWGTEWGDLGYCYIPYKYLLNSTMASDFWVLH
jgi:C1A family cysteine protease